MKRKFCLFLSITALLFAACRSTRQVDEAVASPVIVTEKTPNDTDDPAIWYNRADPAKSLVLGSDKGDSTGGVFVFGLDGKMDTAKSIRNLKRPNNIDVEYGFRFRGKAVDIAVFTERGRDMVRVISLPDCRFIDHGGIPVLDDDTLCSPMGIALYKDKDGEVFAFVSRKTGPTEGYIYQYQLVEIDSYVSAVKVRAFGKFSGRKEIEAIMVDDELGYVYYADEQVGVRKYYADAGKGNEELALFAQTGILEDHEGLSLYLGKEGKGYIILSDQQANKFHLFSREGGKNSPHDHQLVRIVKTMTRESDGSDILNLPLNATFPNGLFVAMSSDRTFQYYKAEDIIGEMNMK
ncbi:MAG: phytase [Prolixibacteraceae bacterium]|jgi:3-phytase|nr:phytase [Prolixibacteraceae bacterium]